VSLGPLEPVSFAKTLLLEVVCLMGGEALEGPLKAN
jgi:hypothetical protein